MVSTVPKPAGIVPHEAKPWWRQRSLFVAVIAWSACIAAIYSLSHGAVPFNRSNLSALSFPAQLVCQVFQPFAFFIFLALMIWRHAHADATGGGSGRSTISFYTLVCCLWFFAGAGTRGTPA